MFINVFLFLIPSEESEDEDLQIVPDSSEPEKNDKLQAEGTTEKKSEVFLWLNEFAIFAYQAF